MNHTFEHNGSAVTLTEHHGVIKITAEKCGMKFNVGQIVDIESENPLIWFENFTGINLVEAIIVEWRLLNREKVEDWENEWMNAPMGER